MLRRLRPLFVVLLCAMIGGLPGYYGPWREGRYRNFRVVEEGVLYRSGQLPPEVLDRVVREYHIRTVISLRDEWYSNGTPRDVEEQRYCEVNGIRHVRISPARWSAPDGSVPAARGVQEFLQVMDDRERLKPILVHCFAGIHRTGANVAVYRMEYLHWTPDEAIAEMLAIQPRRAHFEQDLLAYIRGYRPRVECPTGQP
jgi:protein tyrosine/serine phosphatase